MKTVNVSELIGPALDWAVAKAVGVINKARIEKVNILYGVNSVPFVVLLNEWHYSPSTDWSQGGPMIDSLEFGLLKTARGTWAAVRAMQYAEAIDDYTESPTPLIATCRAIVAAKLGDKIQIPEELLPC